MRGKAGTSINLTIFRVGREEPFEVSVMRGVIELEPVTHKLEKGNIGVISVNEFSRDVGRDVFAARSEEHTSELQSLMRISSAVFCLKKKNTTQKLISETLRN